MKDTIYYTMWQNDEFVRVTTDKQAAENWVHFQSQLHPKNVYYIIPMKACE